MVKFINNKSLVFITRKAHFNAAHRLHNPEKSDQWNKDTFGKCNHEHWHGHNYTLKVTVAGEPGSETGYIVDLAVLKEVVQSAIIEKCDHKNLNLDVAFLDGMLPSTENLAKAFFEELRGPVKEAAKGNGFLYEVELQETEHNSAKYCPFLFGEKLPV